MEEYYLIDFNFTPPLAIERGSYDECQETLEEVAAVDGYGGYQVLSKEGYERALKEIN